MKKKIINLFFRKPLYGKNYSIENFYRGLIKNYKSKNIIIKIKVCPKESNGFFNRLILIFWAFKNQADVNHVCGDINFISLLMSKKKTINTILDLYSLKRLSGIKKFIYYLFWVKLPIYKSSKIIAISNKTKKEILINTNVNKKKISVIDVCAQNIFKKNKKKFIKKNPKILIIGTNENKNLTNIFNSVKNIKCELSIIGILSKDNIYSLNGLNINYKNFINLKNKEIIKQYNECDMLLFPSKYEGFGVPILEAQSVGRIVVTSKLEPMQSVGGNGALYVNPNSVKNIREGILKVINSSHIRNDIISNGFKNIKRFDKNKILQDYLSCYKEVLKNY